MTGGIRAALERAVTDGRVRAAVPLAPLTTFRVGGAADWLVEPASSAELVAVVREAGRLDEPVTMLGGGSNVLVSDAGVRGIVIRYASREIALDDDHTVRADAGTTINGLVRWTVARGLGGPERWAGTPGTVGGAISGNAHFQGELIGSRVRWVTLVTTAGALERVPAGEMGFGYDDCRVQHTGEIVVSAGFIVEPGSPEVLRAAARQSLAFRKATQPLNVPSAGCAFRNPDPVLDPVPAGLPPSAGALIDAAGLKDLRIGGATVSRVHANFVVTDRSATACDVRRVVEACRRAVAERFGITLREELVYLGDFSACP